MPDVVTMRVPVIGRPGSDAGAADAPATDSAERIPGDYCFARAAAFRPRGSEQTSCLEPALELASRATVGPFAVAAERKSGDATRGECRTSSGPAARWASMRVAARPRERQRGGRAGRRGSGRPRAHRRLLQPRPTSALSLIGHGACRPATRPVALVAIMRASTFPCNRCLRTQPDGVLRKRYVSPSTA